MTKRNKNVETNHIEIHNQISRFVNEVGSAAALPAVAAAVENGPALVTGKKNLINMAMRDLMSFYEDMISVIRVNMAEANDSSGEIIPRFPHEESLVRVYKKILHAQNNTGFDDDGSRITDAYARKRLLDAVNAKKPVGVMIHVTAVPQFLRLLEEPALLPIRDSLANSWRETIRALGYTFTPEEELIAINVVQASTAGMAAMFNHMAHNHAGVPPMTIPQLPDPGPNASIDEKTQHELMKSNREYYLRKQMEIIQKELNKNGGGDGEGEDELEVFAKKIEESGMTEEALKESRILLKKLKRDNPESQESSVNRSRLEALIAMPWKAASPLNDDINAAEAILDEDHYGLQKVKEKTIEFMAKNKNSGNTKGPILCFVGPPGVGKTSITKSLARATGREFARMAMGGANDVADIRGHRSTYVGAKAGRPVETLQKKGVNNILFNLDEVDKLGQDHRGRIADALLELLDPEQNNNFHDEYLDVDFDMSKIMFVATANYREQIPQALQDRMNIIEIPGYTQKEKLHIARRHLVKKQMAENGVTADQLDIQDSAIIKLIQEYTREAGVRGLEREIGNICTKIATSIQKGKHTGKVTVTDQNAGDFAGIPIESETDILSEDRVGVVNGLFWSPVGGGTLKIEAVLEPGKDFEIKRFTGSVKDVMQESAQEARSAVQALVRKGRLSKKLDDGTWQIITEEDINKLAVKLHAPAGAIPKDGPSAGLAIATALTSLITNVPIDRFVAMTGEVSFASGDAGTIGGVREKLNGAHRDGVKKVFIPVQNKKHLVEVDAEVLEELDIHPVRNLEEILLGALKEQVIDRDKMAPVTAANNDNNGSVAPPVAAPRAPIFGMM